LVNGKEKKGTASSLFKPREGVLQERKVNINSLQKKELGAGM